MSNIRELSQLASLINVIDESKSIGIITEYPNAKVGIGTLVPTSKVDVVGDVNITGVVTALSASSPFIMSYNQIVESFTIPPNHNSVSVGPILSINSGATITVSINSNWTIIA